MSKELQIKSFGFGEVKVASESGIFEGYASVFENIDAHRDIMEKGAFKKTIQESKRVKVLWQHDPERVIGRPMHMEEDSGGLYVKAKISHTTLGKDVIQLIKDGVIDEMSIGFQTIKDEWDTKANARRIKEVKLWEFSPVTFAANEQANITGVKSMDQTIVKLQTWIDGELKAGKVLSDKNKQLVTNAIEALQALLATTEKGFEPPGAGTQKTLSEDEQKAAEDIKSMLQEIQQRKQLF